MPTSYRAGWRRKFVSERLCWGTTRERWIAEESVSTSLAEKRYCKQG